jgi:hypothetical protein
MGAQDDDTDGTNLGGWAGLNGHVAVECRPPLYIDSGVANIVPPHVQHPPVTQSSIGKPLELAVSFVIGSSNNSANAAVATVTIFDNSSGTAVHVAAAAPTLVSVGNVTVHVTIPARDVSRRQWDAPRFVCIFLNISSS